MYVIIYKAMSREDRDKLLLGLIIFGFVILVLAFTLYMYIAYPKNREYLIERLKNAREINPIKESIEMLKERKKEANE